MSTTIHIGKSVSNSDRFGLEYAGRDSSTVRAIPRHGVPVTIPKGELYFWTARWQADEQESLDAIARGDVQVFDSEDASDAVRWLLTDDEQ